MTHKTTPYAAYAFEALAAHLAGRKCVGFGTFQKLLPGAATVPGNSHPLFVTWNTVLKNGDTSLRGCIGTFEPLDLEKGIKQYSLTAALEDPRFKPIRESELEKLECGVTVLYDFETVADPLDWEVGTHGVKAIFKYRNRRLTATFLPDVAVEQEWDKETTLIHLAQKAGIQDCFSYDDIKDSVQLTRYKGDKSKIAYLEYKDLIEKAL
jgi:uncharacterized protein (TIGR00296 family)